MTTFTTFSESEIVPGNILTLSGVWIHDPEDPINTISNFLYGKDTRANSIAVGGKEQVFAGRKFPVYDYGEHQNDKMSVAIHVPHGARYEIDRARMRRFATMKKPLQVRDNRGRSVYGVMGDLSEEDEPWGTAFSFDIIRVDQPVTEVS